MSITEKEIIIVVTLEVGAWNYITYISCFYLSMSCNKIQSRTEIAGHKDERRFPDTFSHNRMIKRLIPQSSLTDRCIAYLYQRQSSRFMHYELLSSFQVRAQAYRSATWVSLILISHKQRHCDSNIQVWWHDVHLLRVQITAERTKLDAYRDSVTGAVQEGWSSTSRSRIVVLGLG